MQALLLDKPSSIDNLHVGQIPKPEPGCGEVLIKVKACGLNPVDYKLACKGHQNWNYPHILGLDVAGVIAEVGEGVTEWGKGESIYYHGDLSKQGGFAEYAIAKSHVLAPLPEGLSFSQAAALPCAGFTAYQALHRKAHIKRGETILIHGGAGGVGGFAIQMAHLAGLEVITTCSAKNLEYVISLGARHAIDYNNGDIDKEIKKLTASRGVDVVLDTLGPKSATEAFNLLAFNGHLVCVAGLPDFGRINSFEKALSIHEVALGGAYLSQDKPAQEDLGRMGCELGCLVSLGKIKPMLSETCTMEEIPDALNRLAQRHVRGKLVGFWG